MNEHRVSLQAADVDLIAAYIDGGLEGIERDRVAARIADDPAWREVFLETRELLDAFEEASAPGDPNPGDEVTHAEDPGIRSAQSPSARAAAIEFPPRPGTGEGSESGPSPHLQRAWMAAAAIIVLAGASAPFWLRLVHGGPQSTLQMVELARGAGALPDRWQDNAWPRFRGGADSTAISRVVDFRAGVLVAQLAAVQGNSSQTMAILTQLKSQKDEEGIGPADYLASEVETLGADPLSERAFDELDRAMLQFFDESDWFAVGRWAAAARLAAQTGNDRHFQSKGFRAGLDQLESIEVPEQCADAVAKLQSAELNSEEAAWPLLELISHFGGGDAGHVESLRELLTEE